MGILSSVGLIPARAHNEVAEQRAPHDDFWYENTPHRAASGALVTEGTALQISAVYACIRILGESIASLPVMVYERGPNGTRQRATEHPLWELLHDQPNPVHTPFEFQEFRMACLNLRGDSYSEILPGRRGFAGRLEPLWPGWVTPEKLPTGRMRYRYKPDGEPERIIPHDNMHRVMHQSLDGITGLSPIAVQRETLGMTMGANDYANRFWANDTRPGGVVEWDHSFKDREATDQWLQNWRDAQGAVRRGSLALLQNGMKYKQIGMSNEDSQFLETRKFQVEEIARMFRVPPHMLADANRATFASVEQFALEFVTHTLRPWLIRIEQAITRDLIIDRKRYFAEFLVDALLRGDTQTRFDAYGKAITHGFMTRNEVRKKENMNPLDGLDAPLLPLNMAEEGAREPGQSSRAEAFIRDAAKRCAVREVGALAKHLATGGDAADIGEYYKQHRAVVMDWLHLPEETAAAYCDEQTTFVNEHGLAALEGWGPERMAATLTALVVNK